MPCSVLSSLDFHSYCFEFQVVFIIDLLDLKNGKLYFAYIYIESLKKNIHQYISFL